MSMCRTSDSAVADGLLHGPEKLGIFEGLREETVVLEVLGPPRDIGQVTADEDDVEALDARAHAAHELEAVDSRHQHVADDQRRRAGLVPEDIHGLGRAVRGGDIIALAAKEEFDEATDRRLVIDDEYPWTWFA